MLLAARNFVVRLLRWLSGGFAFCAAAFEMFDAFFSELAEEASNIKMLPEPGDVTGWMGLEFLRFWQEQAVWSRATFGSDQERGPEGPLLHLQKEVQETLDNMEDEEEYIDCFFLIIDAARRKGMTPHSFLTGAFQKLEKNKARKWQRSTSNMPVEHVREGE